PDLCAFADALEKATLATIEDGVMTGDLYALSTLENKTKVNTETFLREVGVRLSKIMRNA
ncbi:MAG: NADP-dependent isocitrate dehydrogenase, partial [Clostridia bacterium]|nr:NADP-dependent isocitrate dehydrogenase [Clostridia bacterium]